MLFRKQLLMLFALAVLVSACYKDEGDYVYDMPETPLVTDLDSIYNAYVGDSLIITPKVSTKLPADIELQWRISVPETQKDITATGPSLRIVFGLQAASYRARLTVYNKTNGMKYFHYFTVSGATSFSKGTALLSVNNGKTEFSFIKPDSSVQADLYYNIHGKDLPSDPLSLLFLTNGNYNPPNILGYWIITKNGGVRLSPSTMTEEDKAPHTLRDNFFSAPDIINVGSVQAQFQGVMMAEINGKLYGGTTSTWDQSPTYGMFGFPADGDYELHPSFIMNRTGYFVGFDINRKQFLRFNLYGSPTYFGTQYSVITSAFDPLNVGMELIKMLQINGGACYAYCKDRNGDIYELDFNVNFNGPFEFRALNKRKFIQQDIIKTDTKWQEVSNGTIFISSDNKLYRYTPLNQELVKVAFDFDGKKISMIKLLSDEKTLAVGVEGTLYYIDIDARVDIQSATYSRDHVRSIDGIPGSPIDIAIRQ